MLPFILLGNCVANKGTLFYIQERVGKNGKTFNMVKFRTMIKNAEQSGAVWAKKNDVRITAFGKFLRNTRLDEIPQFINIFVITSYSIHYTKLYDRFQSKGVEHTWKETAHLIAIGYK